MTHCYRIVKKAYEQTAFSGEGPASHPGRWNHRGYRMVYTAESRALAAFEYMVNMQRKSAKKSKFSLFTIRVQAIIESAPHVAKGASSGCHA